MIATYYRHDTSTISKDIILNHKTHLDCTDVISNIPWPIFWVRNIPQQKLRYEIEYIIYSFFKKK